MSAASITCEVAGRFHGLRRAYSLSQLAIAILVSGCVWLFGWLVLAIVDFNFELELETRQIALGAVTSITLLWLLARIVTVLRIVQQRSFAGHLEATFGDFGQRIRTVLDTVDGRVNGPDEMLSALGHQTMGRWETLFPEQLLPKRKVAAAVLAIAAATCICSAMRFSSGDWNTAMQRAIGGAVPYTTLSVTPGDHRILEGETISISLKLTGRIDRQVSVRHRLVNSELDGSADPDADWMESSLAFTPESDGKSQSSGKSERRVATFDVSLGRARKPVEYQFLTSVGDTRIHRIDVQPRIEAVEVAAVVTPPAYTQLERRRLNVRKVTVLEGSEVGVTVQTNHPLHEAVLEVGSRPESLQEVSLLPGDNPKLWAFPLSGDTPCHWKFSGSGPDGTPMKPISGRIRIRRDAGPKIAWRDPADGLEVHTLAEVPMAIQVSDDYGITECGIVFELGDEGEFVLADWSSSSSQKFETDRNTTRVKLSETLPLESFALTDRDFIAYYAYAIDNKDTVPQRSESDIRYIDIRELRQFFQEQELPPGAGTGGGGLRASLSEIIRRERFLVNRTRRMTRSDRTALESQMGTIERMVENQSDLAGLVRSLTEFLVERGNDDVSALNQAEALMLQASDSLAAASFDLALIQQNDSLLALAEARRTLEITLAKRMTPQQRRQFARFNQQLRQKLRRERPKTDQQLADSLEMIANEQRRLSFRVALMQRQSKASESVSTESAAGEATDPQETDKTSQSDESPEASLPPTEDSDDTASELDSDSAATTGNDADADPQEQVFEEQVELMERLQAVTDQLQTRDDLSDLIVERLDTAMQNIDSLTSAARDREYDNFVRHGVDAADQLRELSVHLQAQQPGEAVQRIGRIRDLTKQLAGMEHGLSGKTMPNPAEADAVRKSAPNPAQLNAAQYGSRIANRTRTLEDVLQVPVDMGDFETSEVNDQLMRIVAETEFDERLQDSREIVYPMAETEQEFVSGDESRSAMDRAFEYAEIAGLLDELYLELVAPRINRLRALETRARQLQNPNAKGSGARRQKPDAKRDGQNASEKNDDAKDKAAMQQLKNDLKESGLDELARLLDSSQSTDGQIQQMASLMKPASPTPGEASLTSPIDVESMRLELVVKKLQDQIQQAILLEISADRNAPVPVEYKRLVDGYFRSLAEGVSP